MYEGFAQVYTYKTNNTSIAIMENSTKLLKELKIEIPHDPAILRLGIYPMKSKTLI